MDPTSFTGFEWDDGNDTKSLAKHRVTCDEAQQALLNNPLVAEDTAHSQRESRWRALGQTDVGRLLYVSFTTRGNLLRVISARPMHKKERMIYEKQD